MQFHKANTSPKLVNTSTGSYDDDQDLSPTSTFYGSPLATAYIKERLCATNPPKFLANLEGQQPRIRKAPACPELNMEAAGIWPVSSLPRVIDEDIESPDEDDDTLYFVPGLDGVYSPGDYTMVLNEWAKMASSSSTPSQHDARFAMRAALFHETTFDDSLLKDKSSGVGTNHSLCDSEFGWNFEQGTSVSRDSPQHRDKP